MSIRQAKERRRNAMPLEQFPPEHRRMIQELADAPEPPERWRHFGDPESRRPLAWMESRAWLEWHWQRGIYPGAARPKIPRYLREAVIARDGHVCQICQGDVDPTDIHLDHIKPYSKGGPTTLANLRVTHSLCNIRKGARY